MRRVELGNRIRCCVKHRLRIRNLRAWGLRRTGVRIAGARPVWLYDQVSTVILRCQPDSIARSVAGAKVSRVLGCEVAEEESSKSLFSSCKRFEVFLAADLRPAP